MRKKISQLPQAGAITGAEIVEIVQDGQNKQATVENLNLGSGPGDVTHEEFDAAIEQLEEQLDDKWNVTGATSIPSDATVTIQSGTLTITRSDGTNRRFLLSNASVQMQFGSNNAVQVTGTTATFRSSVGGANIKGIDISPTIFLITDSHSLAGMHYSADYSANGISQKGDRWIPDYGAAKSYADSRATNATFVSALIAGLTAGQKQDLVAALIDEIRATINEE